MDETHKTAHINIHNNSIHDILSPYPADAGISLQSSRESVTVTDNSLVNTGELGLEVRAPILLWWTHRELVGLQQRCGRGGGGERRLPCGLHTLAEQRNQRSTRDDRLPRRLLLLERQRGQPAGGCRGAYPRGRRPPRSGRAIANSPGHCWDLRGERSPGQEPNPLRHRPGHYHHPARRQRALCPSSPCDTLCSGRGAPFFWCARTT